jgi:hypothetical protein
MYNSYLFKNFYSTTDWAKTELTELAKMDIELNELNNTTIQMRFAWKAKLYDSNIAFNDNKYNAINSNLLRCNEHFYLDFVLDIINKLENDILLCQTFGVYLQKYSRIKKFEDVIRITSEKNRLINFAISEMEEKILMLIADIREINIYSIELDEEELLQRNMKSIIDK